LELETPAKTVSEAARPEPVTKLARSSALAWTVTLFALLWVIFFSLQRALPYVRNGSDIVFHAKLQLEAEGSIFPSNPSVERVLIFGNSKTLAGFLPSLFEEKAASDKLTVSAFNSGFPGSDLFLPPLKTMCARGQAPNVLLMTLPWAPSESRRDLFHLIPDDHAVIESLFPFRNFIRDIAGFVMAAPGHGGMVSYYKEAERDEREVVAHRGYYLITEQSHFPGSRLPDNFHLPSDQPNWVLPRIAEPRSPEAGELNNLLKKYRIRCFFVPTYQRIGEYASPAAYDQGFAATVENATSCKVLGPDYYLYPNRFFADQTHLNTTGARVYTQALFHLLESALSQGRERALQ
jgi:hypothetical protein